MLKFNISHFLSIISDKKIYLMPLVYVTWHINCSCSIISDFNSFEIQLYTCFCLHLMIIKNLNTQMFVSKTTHKVKHKTVNKIQNLDLNIHMI